jgi:hypothetical protein
MSIEAMAQQGMKAAYPDPTPAAALPLDRVMGELGSEIEALGAQLGKLESRLSGILGESNPHPEQAPEPPPGTSTVVYLLGQMRNTVLVYRNTLGSILARLEV